jgi:hypothetical protein
MGGGQSSIQQQVIQDPKPVGPDPSTGLSLSTSEGCGKCELVIDGDISASMVEMFRTGDPMENPRTPGPMSANTMAIIIPTLPFKAKFNGVQESFGALTVYAPSPIRIESVQHDAVLQIGDPGRNKVVLLVPLVGSSLAAPSVDFMQKVCGTIQTLSGPSSMVDAPGVTDGSKKVYAKIPVPTGSSWKLTNMIGPTDPYFTWVNADYESYVRSENPSFKVMGWKPKDGVRYIVMQNPAPIAETDLAAIRMLPITKPGDVLTSLGKVFYKSGTPKNCTTCKPVIPTLPAFPDIATSTIAAPSAGTGGSDGVSTETILKILGYVVGALAIGLAIYFGVKYAMDNKWASVLPKIGESIQRQMAKAYAKQKAAVAAMPATIVPEPVGEVAGPRLTRGTANRRLVDRNRTARIRPGTARPKFSWEKAVDVRREAANPIANVADRDPVNLPEPVGEVVGPRLTRGTANRGLVDRNRTARIRPGTARPTFSWENAVAANPITDVAARDPVNLPEPVGEVAGPRLTRGTANRGLVDRNRTARIRPGTARPTFSWENAPIVEVAARESVALPGRTGTRPRAMRDVLPRLPRPRRLARGTADRTLIERDPVADAQTNIDRANATMARVQTNAARMLRGVNRTGTTSVAEARANLEALKAKRLAKRLAKANRGGRAKTR